jgi:hypothetical protein
MSRSHSNGDSPKTGTFSNKGKLTSLDEETLRIVEGSVIQEPVDYQIIEVFHDITNPLFAELAHQYFVSFSTSVAARGGTLSFDETRFRLYLETILASRIAHCRGERTILRPTDRVNVPSFFSAAIAQIGRVDLSADGITLIPQLRRAQSATPLLSPAEVFAVSNALAVLERFGFTFADGYDRDRYGSEEFMTLELIGNQVLGDRRDRHPVYAVFAAILGNSGLKSVINGRRRYGDIGMFRSLVVRFTEPRRV